MGRHSGVDWCDYSHGFWYGCRKVSPGCLNCYAERNMKRFGQDFNTVTRAKGFSKPLSWKESGRVFVCPHSDFFIEDADEWRGEAWEIMRRTPHLTFLILTKRPENIIDRLPVDWMGEYLYGGGYNNVWLGVTAENQKMADRRIPILLQIPAAVRFVSVEPMIGPVDLQPAHGLYYDQNGWDARRVDWTICGGESGQNPREMEEEWAKNLLDQCREAGVAFFMKQMSGKAPIPDYLNVREFPDK